METRPKNGSTKTASILGIVWTRSMEGCNFGIHDCYIWLILLSLTSQSIMTGRPPHFTSQMADCEYPNDNGATIDEDGTTVESGA